MRKILILLIIFLLSISCSHKVWKTYKTKEQGNNSGCEPALVRIHPHDSIAEKVGEAIMDDIGLSINCSEEETMNYLKNEACKIDADIILVKQIKRPNLDSYCYRCTAVFYKLRAGANPVATKKYFEQQRIERRDQKDTKQKISRTIYLIHAVRNWLRLFRLF